MKKILKIKVMLPSLFAVMVMLGIIQGGVALYSIDDMDTETDRMMERLVRARLVGEMETTLGDVRRQYAMLLAAEDDQERASAFAEIKGATDARKAAFAAYEGLELAPVARDLYVKVKDAAAVLDGYGEELQRQYPTMTVDQADKLSDRTLKPAAETTANLLKDMVIVSEKAAAEAAKQAKQVGSDAFKATSAVILLAAAIAAFAAFISFFRVARPIDDITSSMKGLAAGDTSREIPHGGRQDEIGDMAAAVAVFRANALEREKLERDAETNRSLSEKERQARAEEAAKEAANVQFAVDSLADGLRHLSDGDMTYRLRQPFVGQLDVVRANFNESVEKLQVALRSVGENARMIDAGASEIRSATENLSRRTEQQAASVEETAAALEQVTTAVKESAVKAGEAGSLVEKTRVGAEHSGEVVRKAVVAMQEIEKSSNEISNIIGVIDDIAFQTNLLALNAGVEAARAGEAGKGFAVVAQEVRELAQRSANAAKEIKALITKSGEQVRGGVELVGETGQALASIVTEVQNINYNVSAIVSSSREQSTGLAEINAAVNQMDQGTQQNASMVEESTAAIFTLASQAAALTALLGQFQLGTETAIRAVDTRAAGSARPQASPARELGKRLNSAFTSRGSAAVAVSSDNWTEF